MLTKPARLNALTLLLLAGSAAAGFFGAGLVAHGHSSATDGGRITNLSLLGTLTATGVTASASTSTSTFAGAVNFSKSSSSETVIAQGGTITQATPNVAQATVTWTSASGNVCVYLIGCVGNGSLNGESMVSFRVDGVLDQTYIISGTTWPVTVCNSGTGGTTTSCSVPPLALSVTAGAAHDFSVLYWTKDGSPVSPSGYSAVQGCRTRFGVKECR